MRLCTLDDFSEEHWQRSFGAYVEANKSHWTGPPYDVVRNILYKKGKYEFSVKSMGTWASRFVLEVREGDIHAEFETNPSLSSRMKEHLERMRETFERELNA